MQQKNTRRYTPIHAPTYTNNEKKRTASGGATPKATQAKEDKRPTNNSQINRKLTEKQTDTQTEAQSNRKTDTKTDRGAGKQTGRHRRTKPDREHTTAKAMDSSRDRDREKR